MLKMLKKRVVLFSIIVMLVVASSSVVFAETDENNNSKNTNFKVAQLIEDINEAKDDGLLTAREQNEIFSNVSPSVLEVYKEIVVDEAIEEIQNSDVVLGDDEQYKRTIIDLDSGGTLTIELSDVAEPSFESKAIEDKVNPPVLRATGMTTTDHIVYRTVYKDYGARYFTAQYTIGYLRGWIKLITENHYTISASGLDERYGVTDVRYEYLLQGFDHIKHTWKITDSSARKVGDDINLVGTLTFALSGNSGQGLKTMELDTRVLLKVLDTKNKRAQVQEHVYISKNFF